jgi:hypothetical protein
VVESSGLLNRRRVKNSTGGSNPPLSAINNLQAFGRMPETSKLAFATRLLTNLSDRYAYPTTRVVASRAFRRAVSVRLAASSSWPGIR